MKETVDTNKIIRQVHLDIDKALTKAKHDVDLAVSTAELKLNEVMQAKKDQRSAGRHLSFLYTTIIASIGFAATYLASVAIDVNVLQTNLLPPLETLSLEPSSFRFKVLVFTAASHLLAALFGHVAGFLCFRLGNGNGNEIRLSQKAKVKIELVDKGCQTILEEASETEESDGKHDSMGQFETTGKTEDIALLSASSVDGSLTFSDTDGEAVEDGEKILHKAYVTPMRLVGNKWRNYGKLHLNISSINGKLCMVFRNDIGVLHMNLPITKGMTFETVKSKEGSNYIRFMSIEDEVRGMECFMLKVSSNILDKLHSKLVEVSSE